MRLTCQAIHNHPERQTWTRDTKSVLVGGFQFKLKDFDLGTEEKLGM